jgi:hypothetical protein
MTAMGLLGLVVIGAWVLIFWAERENIGIPR